MADIVKAAASGRFHLNSVYATAVNVNAMKSGTSVIGSLSIVNNEGIVVYANVASLDVDSVNGFPHASIKSKSFPFKNVLSTDPKVLAHVEMDLTQHSSFAECGFRIVSDVDGVVLAQTALTGTYAPVPFEWGTALIG